MSGVRNAKRGNGAARKAGVQQASELPPLDALTIAGFKSIRDSTRIALRPLTVLAGQNSSGKSSAMQPLLLLKQTLEAPYDPGPLRLDGDNVRFSSAEQLVWEGVPHSGRTREFSVAFGALGQALALVFRRRQRGLVLDHMSWRAGTNELVLSENDELDFPVEQLPALLRNQLDGQPLPVRVVRQRCLLALRIVTPLGGVVDAPIGGPFDVEPYLAGLIHVPGLRGNPVRHYPTTRVGDNFPGVFSHYTASVIAAWGEARDSRLTRLGASLHALGLTWKAEAHRVDDTRVELRVGRLAGARRGGADDLVNVADVGFGVSQVLPVLVALLVAKPGQIVYLEQPEIHLHPKAQVALAACLLEAAQRGVLVVAETHSHLVLRGIQEQVAAGKYPASLVALHWFARDAAGATHVTSADLDRDGAFGDWPEDLSATELEIEDRYLRHVAPKA